MKRTSLYFFIFTFPFFLSTSTAEAVEVDGIAATVGREPILRSDVIRELKRRNLDETRFDEVRNSLVDRRLILKAAGESKMTMQEWVIENRIREIIDKGFGGDRNKLVALLGQEKVPYTEWRQRIKEDMIVNAMRWNIIDKNVSTSPAEMQAEFKAHPERYRAQARVTVSVILLRPEEADKRATIKEALKARPFADLAKEYSAGTHAAEGGVWKDVRPEEVFKPEICAEIAKLKKGETSDWIDIGGWSFLLKKDDETVAHARTFAEAYDDVEENVRQANSKKLFDAWMDRLRAETYIKIY